MGEVKLEEWLKKQTHKQTNNTQSGVRKRVVNKPYRSFYPLQGIWSPISLNFYMALFVWKKSWGCPLLYRSLEI